MMTTQDNHKNPPRALLFSGNIFWGAKVSLRHNLEVFHTWALSSYLEPPVYHPCCLGWKNYFNSSLFFQFGEWIWYTSKHGNHKMNSFNKVFLGFLYEQFNWVNSRPLRGSKPSEFWGLVKTISSRVPGFPYHPWNWYDLPTFTWQIFGIVPYTPTPLNLVGF